MDENKLAELDAYCDSGFGFGNGVSFCRCSGGRGLCAS